MKTLKKRKNERVQAKTCNLCVLVVLRAAGGPGEHTVRSCKVPSPKVSLPWHVCRPEYWRLCSTARRPCDKVGQPDYVCMYACMYVRMYVCMHASMCVSMYVCACVYVCMHACMCVCMCVCVPV